MFTGPFGSVGEGLKLIQDRTMMVKILIDSLHRFIPRQYKFQLVII